MKITLPWPDRRLSPNSRAHWAVTSKVKAKARKDATHLTYDAMQKHLATQAHFAGEHRLPVKVTFYPPDNRRRDDDNMVASFKAWRDGIADALGVDDRRFAPEYHFADAVKPGRIEVDFIPVILKPDCLEDSRDVLQKSGPQCCDNSTAGLTTNDEDTSHGS